MSGFVPTKVLPSGHRIPAVALGVLQSKPGAEVYNAVLAALKLGYRHIDTADAYENEVDVGRAVHDSGIPREEVFATTKFYDMSWAPWSTTTAKPWNYQEVIDAVQESNKKLGLGYIDLYLLHAPALEDMQAKGVVRDIGVSNFGEQHLTKLAKTWRVKPAVNQVELHPWLARADTVKFCQDQSIVMEAYSPLSRAEKMNDPALLQIASELDATPAQALVAWSLAKGFVPLPKSVTESRARKTSLRCVSGGGSEFGPAYAPRLEGRDSDATWIGCTPHIGGVQKYSCGSTSAQDLHHTNRMRHCIL
ncbi:hypothetical protein PHYSODRAFT_338079 [Phytophthora sojae]|uniref:NADP-dependent oxidoreductase domain-containing protein n=1 Tax=Phytophthora sojae (strain P6497) TaxID=1094619 RepID=G5A0H6_PHYSP|nr:hypothetical protein PHYSODRAFT_338079 [Phytophthora sojae]EGZ11365.1 hypothetical protein PHYSODRAFT_338079 [Phytophthora sojae]|eukprot:XP_009534110.1 hypothetical protein PHYSODRAFT_338079 [Phytophthora sojae]